jgi:hypothetical protein
MISALNFRIGGGGGATPAPVGQTLMKTGQTTSYRTGDDGDLRLVEQPTFQRLKVTIHLVILIDLQMSLVVKHILIGLELIGQLITVQTF